MTLTNLKVEKIKPSSKPKKYADDGGLYLHVYPNGSKYWRLRYRYLGKENTISAGTFPEVSLADARNKRQEVKTLLRQGKDPSSEKKEQIRTAKYSASNQFSSVAIEWFELNKDKWTPKYASKVKNRLETYVMPVIGYKPINEVSGLEILDDIIRKLERKGHTETAHKLLQNCAAIFRLAFLTRRVPFNPLSDIRGVLKPHKTTSFPTIRIHQLKDFMQQIDECQTSTLNKLAIKMLVLTFVRQGELRTAKWEHFDLDKKLWYIPAELMKMRQEHIVPLAHQTIELLKGIKSLSGNSEYLFPTKNKIKHPYMNENVINDVIKKTEYSGKIVAHGFRSLASTTLNELGIAPDIIEKQLAHSERNQVRAAYNRAQYLPQRIEMMQQWADYIDSIIK
jgi:integrase